MAITSAGTNIDRVFRNGAQAKSVFESGLPGVQIATPSFNQGSLICFDSTVPGIRAIVSTADAATILGISPVGIVAGKLVGPYDGLTATNAAQAPSDFRGPIHGFEASMKLKNGDAFTFGCEVYAADGLDDQTVTVTDSLGSGFYIGYYTGAAVTPTSVGTTGPIYLVSRFPVVAE